MRKYEFIAEVKTASPFGFRAMESWDALFELANRVGDMISIHTDPRWDGSFELLTKARQKTKKPLLAKGIHAHDDDVTRALDLGANVVLVVGRIPGIHADKCLIEPASVKELAAVPKTLRAVWNSRDLHTGGLKKETFQDARDAFTGWLCAASNIRTISDIPSGADAILVGTHLRQFVESLELEGQ